MVALDRGLKLADTPRAYPLRLLLLPPLLARGLPLSFSGVSDSTPLVPCLLFDRLRSISIVLFLEAPKARDWLVEAAPPEPEARPCEEDMFLKGLATALLELPLVTFAVCAWFASAVLARDLAATR